MVATDLFPTVAQALPFPTLALASSISPIGNALRAAAPRVLLFYLLLLTKPWLPSRASTSTMMSLTTILDPPLTPLLPPSLPSQLTCDNSTTAPSSLLLPAPLSSAAALLLPLSASLMLLASLTTTTSTFSTGARVTRSLSVLSAMSTSGLPMKVVLAVSLRPLLTHMSAASSGLVMAPMSVLVWELARSRSGTLQRARRFEACSAMIHVLVSWDGTSTFSRLVLVAVLSTTTTFALPSTRLLSSSPTHPRFAALSGALMAHSSLLAATTTSSPSGMHDLCPFPSSPRPTTRPLSRPSLGALGT
ncbi:hypothetical protein LB505_013555 [Fusarium chuoi]|nr:hypothetical protein LB505_013555 [Fusarium chuoi]